ncbi:MAG: hypothetical protein JWP63_2098 [Candidatus Solibacter sp.]|jgi:uncharacterized coiled-coil DUF342 family protein|nr:hypothetical protein [Candidatus Solibacter sp.]
MQDRYPPTIEQLRQTNEDVGVMAEQAKQIAQLMLACHGESDQRTIRAQEAHAALVRLQTEMGREHAKGVSQ